MAGCGVAKVAVLGSGISGAVCASILASKGISVTIFESGRGPGGRMSQRREKLEDGTELYFDHGAPYFTVSNADVANLIKSWENRGFISEWNERFRVFDFSTKKFADLEMDEARKKYVGVPAMNSICKALCQENGIEAKFGVTVGKMNWINERNSWSLIGMDEKELGQFDGIIGTAKNIFSPRFTSRPPPLDISQFEELSILSQEIPVRSCFALMLAFSEPLNSVPVRGFCFKNSEILSWAFCDSSKPNRITTPPNGQNWVLHSTHEYASMIVQRDGLKKPSNEILSKIAEELFQEFQKSGLNVPTPFFMKAHRWGSAFPAISIGGEEKCIWNKEIKLAICGDFCTSPNVEGAILSGIKAASKFQANLNFSSGL
ncbi:hypothetical protein LUZ60_010342 [Juncus effusus]|nr:hypothetical protein LUZ60_010342 [Juncus effusus]